MACFPRPPDELSGFIVLALRAMSSVIASSHTPLFYVEALVIINMHRRRKGGVACHRWPNMLPINQSLFVTRLGFQIEYKNEIK